MSEYMEMGNAGNICGQFGRLCTPLISDTADHIGVKIGVLDSGSGIAPVHRDTKVVAGVAFPCRNEPTEEWIEIDRLLEMLDALPPEAFVVVAEDHLSGAAQWGGLMSRRALAQGAPPTIRQALGAGMPSVVTVGETMVLGVPARPERLRHAHTLELKIGGAESNVAIALSRLSITAGWVSCLSSDELGQLVLDRIRGEGVDTSHVRRVEHRPTGLYLRENIGHEARAYYYREGSAACEMAPEAFDPDYLEGAKFLHLTGITPAISENCRDFTLWAAEQAHERGVRVSFDVNYRSKLCAPKEAKGFVEELLSQIDVLMVGDEEALALWGRDDEALLRELAEGGPSEVVLKRGKEGSAALLGGVVHEQAAFPVTEVDPIGAGDSFAAGYLAGDLWGLSPKERLRVAGAMGAYSVMTLGDYEGLPDRQELDAFLSGKTALGR